MLVALAGTVPGTAISYLIDGCANADGCSWLFGGLIDVLLMGAAHAVVY